MRSPKRKSFQIYASKACIENSERNSLHWCIFALAIIYSVRGSQHVSVDQKEVRFSWQGFRYIFPTPEKTARIASAYDRGILAKRDIAPWRDELKEPISIEPVQHKRPSKHVKAKAPKRSSGRKCSRNGSTRWAGRRI